MGSEGAHLMSEMPRLIVGNWKMHGLAADLAEARALTATFPEPHVDIVLCPPATLIARMAVALSGSGMRVGGQDCHAESSGAHTGDISAAMLADAGASHVILGHSERRADHGETSAEVAQKVLAAWKAGLVTIICIGETEAERDAGSTLDVVAAQLEYSLPSGATRTNTVVAYEPIWAIGTGRIPRAEEIGQVHAFLRSQLPDRGIRLLYGGSVKPDNVASVFAVAEVDGALVGGASLKAADFGPIIGALSHS
jgi:triosephosphate isomerase (TIM)